MERSVVYLDVIGGLSGDMMLAALIDAGASVDRIQNAVDAVLPNRFLIRTAHVNRAHLRALLLTPERIAREDGGKLHEGHRRSAGQLIASITQTSLDAPIKEMALAVVKRLVMAEAKVHGIRDPDEMSLDQLGEDDTLLDLVGIAAALRDLGVGDIIVSPLPVGGGTVASHSSRIPLPAPATLELLKGFVVRGEAGLEQADELVTPTAGAVLAALARSSARWPTMEVQEVGYGAGARNPPNMPNIVRVIVGRMAGRMKPGANLEGTLSVMEANIDDLSPELVSDATQHLRERGAVDVWITPILMKKGRPGVIIGALCPAESQEAVTQAFFEATSTFGIRWYRVERSVLARHTSTVRLSEYDVRIKTGIYNGRVVSVKPEHDDVAEVARRTSRSVRSTYDRVMGLVRGEAPLVFTEAEETARPGRTDVVASEPDDHDGS